ncbi:hypothetical protein [Shinella zoogloeoides]|jgi:hypothetical protein|uniref:hypothetical protein n=1 Tax=Shinella zoogloeoides TaxID=352475 RepID=UPI00273FB74A|nr:hypothetical protein [Shinella zoogloeoides]WLR93262.1 hypothetical protein Q9316_03400 [Shinella zoogloeoides]
MIKLALFAAMCALVPSACLAGPLAVAVAIYEFYDNAITQGRAWQDQQNWGRMSSWRAGGRVFIGNLTDGVVTFSFVDEDEECESLQETLQPGGYVTLWCDGGGNGIMHYYISFAGKSYHLEGWKHYSFEHSAQIAATDLFFAGTADELIQKRDGWARAAGR